MIKLPLHFQSRKHVAPPKDSGGKKPTTPRKKTPVKPTAKKPTKRTPAASATKKAPAKRSAKKKTKKSVKTDRPWLRKLGWLSYKIG